MKKFFFIKLLIVFLLLGCKSSNLVDPSTTIRYSVPEKSFVKLTIENNYNTTIATLVDEEKYPGAYEVSFDLSNLAEGVYFYTIELEGIGNDYYSKITRSMLLLK